jgi:hypothetical protein
MTDAVRNREPDERVAAADAASPTWHWSFRESVEDLVGLLNNPYPLPAGAVSVTAVNDGFHILWFE